MLWEFEAVNLKHQRQKWDTVMSCCVKKSPRGQSRLPQLSISSSYFDSLIHLFLFSARHCWYSRERTELLPRLPLQPCTRAAGMGNADRQQSDSRVSAEGKWTACIKKQGGMKSVGRGRQTDRQTGREGKGKRQGQSEKWVNREPSLQPLLVFGQQPALPSEALREMEREGWKR